MDTDEDEKEPTRYIVGIMFWENGKRFLTRDIHRIRQALESGCQFELLDQNRMRLMASFDLGPQWDAWKDAPVLFIIEDGKLRLSDELEAFAKWIEEQQAKL